MCIKIESITTNVNNMQATKSDEITNSVALWQPKSLKILAAKASYWVVANEHVLKDDVRSVLHFIACYNDCDLCGKPLCAKEHTDCDFAFNARSICIEGDKKLIKICDYCRTESKYISDDAFYECSICKRFGYYGDVAGVCTCCYEYYLGGKPLLNIWNFIKDAIYGDMHYLFDHSRSIIVNLERLPQNTQYRPSDGDIENELEDTLEYAFNCDLYSRSAYLRYMGEFSHADNPTEIYHKVQLVYKDAPLFSTYDLINVDITFSVRFINNVGNIFNIIDNKTNGPSKKIMANSTYRNYMPVRRKRLQLHDFIQQAFAPLNVECIIRTWPWDIVSQYHEKYIKIFKWQL